MPGEGVFLEFSFKVQIFRPPPSLVGHGSKIDGFTREAAQAVVNAASALITSGRRYSGQHPERGHLADSGRVVNNVSASLSYLAVFDHEAALVHHNGAAGHSISTEKGAMRNDYIPATSKGGTFRSVRPVWHPGHEGNPYLIKAAQSVGLSPSGSLLRGSSLTPAFRAPAGFA